MVQKVLRGHVASGCRDANNWGISEIRKATGFEDLKAGTLNVRLESPHNLRPDYKLLRGNRKDERDEDLFFESCCLVIGSHRVPALIARTTTNYWKSEVLEIMAEEILRERYDLQDGDVLDIEVWAEI
jgi:CTP-dependent riboflavin kinase